MSTSYYRPNPPITHMQMEKSGGHAHLSVWVRYRLAGVLALRLDELRDMVLMFALNQDDSRCPLRTHWGGKER